MTSGAPRRASEYADRASALSAFISAAAGAPTLLPADEGAGCPLFHALAALQWSGETGLVQPHDRLHAAWFADEAAATMIERHDNDAVVFRFYGPKIEARQATPVDGKHIVDELWVQGWEFQERGSALAHFFVTTQGEGALVCLMASNAPEVENVRRWLLELFQGPLPAGADHLHACWFTAAGAGFLFPPTASVQEQRGFAYVELGTRD